MCEECQASYDAQWIAQQTHWSNGGSELDRWIERYIEALSPLADTYPTQLPHWVYVINYFGREFENEGWLCEAHANAFSAKYGGDVEVDPYGPETDSIGHCIKCGCALAPMVLSDEGVESELQHWAGAQLQVHPGQHWELRELAYAVSNGNDYETKQRLLTLLDRFRAGGAI
ncbi:hypothetical protein [Deinococcus soli (ex Cha et al. 2016)]|uniref:hypothetical protein n=1 Tax=Deinococcus soli (ex Cha et al. 2016) TaxID=1309411 RepID=UPI0036D4386D